MMQNGELHSEMKLSRTNVRDVDRGEFSVEAVLTMPEHVAKDCHIAIKHVYNTTDMTSSAEINTDSRVWKVYHDLNTSLIRSDGKLTLRSDIGLETPFDYLTKASVTTDAELTSNARENGMMANLKLTFDEEELNIDLNGSIEMSSPMKTYNLKAKTSGSFGESSLETVFVNDDQECKFTSQITDTSRNHYDLKMTLKPTDNDLAKNGGEVEIDLSIPNHDPIKAKGKAFMQWSADEIQAEGSIEIKSGNELLTEDSFVFKKIRSPYLLVETFGSFYSPIITNSKVKFEANLDTSTGLNLHGKLNDLVSGDLTFTKEENGKSLYHLSIQTENHDLSSQGSLSSTDVTLELNVDDHSSKFEGKMTQDANKLSMVCKLTDTYYGTLTFDSIIDVTTKNVDTKVVVNDKFVELSGAMTSMERFELKLRNNLVEDLKLIHLDAKIDNHFIISAKANEVNIFLLQGQLGATDGSASMQINLLQWHHNGNFNYQLSDGQGQAKLNMNNDNFAITWYENELKVETPFKSIQNLVLTRVLEIRNQEQRNSFHLIINDDEVASMQTVFSDNPYTMEISVTSVMTTLSTLKLSYRLNSLSNFNLQCSINDMVDVKLTGLLNAEHVLYTAKLFIASLMHYETTVGYKWKAGEKKTVDFILRNPTNVVTLQGKIEETHAILEVDSEFFTRRLIEADWDTTQGVMDIVARTENVEYLRSELKFDSDPNKSYAGSLNFTTTAIFLDNAINAYSKYEVGGESKTAAMILSVGGEFVTMSTVFKFYEDTFNGELLWKSSLPGYEVAIVNARYNIATQPTASISLEKNGKIYFIRTKLTFDNVIPTVRIETSIPGFERLLFKGNWQQHGNAIQFDISLTRNQEDILFMITTNIRMTKDMSDTELIVEMMTPIRNWQSFGAELGWKKNPYAFKFKVHRDREQYHLKGKLSLRHKEFNLEASTPFEGLESVTLSGKMGTTQLGQHMGLSLSQNTVRRDLSMAYEVDDNTAKLLVKMPLDRFSMIKVRTPRSIAMSNMDFAFETQGQQNDYAFGMRYDLSKGLSNGDFLLKVKAPGKLPEVEAKLEYNNVDFIADNGFDGMFYVMVDEMVMVSAEIKRTPGHTNVQVKTPIREYQDIKMELKSDYETNIFASISVNNKVTSVNLQKNGDNVDIELKTTLRGYETIKISIKKLDAKTYLIEAFRHETLLTSLKIVAELKIALKQAMLKVEWKATDSLWANLALVFNDGNGDISFQAPNKDFKADWKSEETGDTSVFAAHMELDGKTLDYESERVWSDGTITGKSSYQTTMDISPKNQKSSYEINYDLNRPLLLR